MLFNNKKEFIPNIFVGRTFAIAPFMLVCDTGNLLGNHWGDGGFEVYICFGSYVYKIFYAGCWVS